MTAQELQEIIDRARKHNWKTLDLSDEQIESLPDMIGHLTTLLRLDLNRNRLTRLPDSIGLLRNLAELSVNDNCLTRLPASIGHLANLTRLNLNNNNLTSLPTSVGNLTSLRSLGVGNNQLHSLPEDVGKLTGLSRLNLSRNRFVSLPDNVCNLTGLTELNLEDNQIVALPQGIGKLTSLTCLHLQGNRLTSLPESIGQLTNLTDLGSDDNQLVSLPENIGDLAKLTQLGVDENRLNSLPESIGKLKGLRKLQAGDNPFHDLPAEVVAESSRAVLEYYRELKLSRANRSEGRVIVIGPAGSGKSCLSRALCGEWFKKDWVPTIGFDIHKFGLVVPDGIVLDTVWEVEKPEWSDALEMPGADQTTRARQSSGMRNLGATPVMGILRQTEYPRIPDFNATPFEGLPATPKGRVNDSPSSPAISVWDFGGQEKVLPLNQLLLPKRALYLLVIGADQSEIQNLPEFWLDLIKACVPEARVFLVITKAAETASKFDFERLRNRYGKLIGQQGYFRVDSKSGMGIAELRSEICREVFRFDRLDIKWPGSWLGVENEIRTRVANGETHISRSELYRIMFTSGVETLWSRELLARILGRLGCIRHFPDSPSLRDLIILNQSWLARGLHPVLELSSEKGVLNVHQLIELWLKEYANRIPLLYHCLEEFGLCCTAERHQHDCLILSHLPQERIGEMSWSDIPDRRRRQIVYSFSFLPPGMMARFIARTSSMQCQAMWAEGVFLRKYGSEALCRLEPDSREISIEVRGKYPERFLNMLCDCLEAILEDYRGLAYKKLLGCPGAVDCSGTLEYEHLHEAMSHGIETVACSSGRHQLKTAELRNSLQGIVEHRQIMQSIQQMIGSILEKMPDTDSLPDPAANQLAEMARHLQQSFVDWLWCLDPEAFRSCPSLISIRPKDGQSFYSDSWFTREYVLRLYCQSESGIHPVGRSYEFKRPPEWWLKTIPYLSQVYILLQVMNGPAGRLLADQMTKSTVMVTLSELEAALLFLEKIRVSVTDRLDSAQEQGNSATSVIVGLVNECDPGGYWNNWLTRVKTPGKKTLWLCEEHAREYLIRSSLTE